jgi:hypothetical protein
MGSIHVHARTIEEAAHSGTAWSGEIVDLPGPDQLDLQIGGTFTRCLPERKGALRRAWERFTRAGRSEAPEVRRFELSPEPVAEDSFSHPVFERLEGALHHRQLHVGQRVLVVQSIFTCVIPDDPETRARLVAAFDRSADLAWAAGASVGELELGLLDRARWDAALGELRWRRAFEPRGLARRLPRERLGGLQGVVGRMQPDEETAFFEGAARDLDRADLAVLATTLRDHTQLRQLMPILLRLDPTEDARILEFARIRLEMVLRDEPHRAEEFRRLAEHVARR